MFSRSNVSILLCLLLLVSESLTDSDNSSSEESSEETNGETDLPQLNTNSRGPPYGPPHVHSSGRHGEIPGGRPVEGMINQSQIETEEFSKRTEGMKKPPHEIGCKPSKYEMTKELCQCMDEKIAECASKLDLKVNERKP